MSRLSDPVAEGRVGGSASDRWLAFLVVFVSLSVVSAGFAQPANYVIGPDDVLLVTVLNQPEISGIFTVERDGTFTFTFLERVTAGGLSVSEFEASLRSRLADGFFKQPQVTVVVQEYRSQRIFLVGELRTPGTYELRGGMTIIEAVAGAGSLTSGASGEVTIVRRLGAERALSLETAVAAGAPGAKIIKVDLAALEAGDLSQNIELEDGDTLWVHKALTIYVFGEVRSPGAYPLLQGTTLLQALSLAGGVTDFGAMGRIKAIRIVDGERMEVRLELDDIIQPNDTIVVPERFF